MLELLSKTCRIQCRCQCRIRFKPIRRTLILCHNMAEFLPIPRRFRQQCSDQRIKALRSQPLFQPWLGRSQYQPLTVRSWIRMFNMFLQKNLLIFLTVQETCRSRESPTLSPGPYRLLHLWIRTTSCRSQLLQSTRLKCQQGLNTRALLSKAT